MWRSIHSWIGLLGALLVMTLALTGTVLSTQPLYQAYTTDSVGSDVSVADVIKRIATTNKRIEPQRLKVMPSGEAKLSYSRNSRLREDTVALDSGKFIRGQKEPELYVFVRDLHRSFLLGEKGRLLPAAGGIVMTLLCLSGIFLLLRRLGGWRQFLDSISLRGAANQHASLGRWALLPLTLTAMTALWLSAVTFNLVSSGEDKPPAYPESLEELDRVDPWTLHGLQEIPITDVKELVYPIPDDWFDVWTVRTASEYIFIDQFTGDVISRESLPALAKMMDWVMFFHTAEGSVGWAIVLFFSSLSVPFFAVTGTIVWWRNKRKGKGRIRNNASATTATTLIVVGSEGGSTWGFAKALHRGLHAAGERVRTIEMNAIGVTYPKLKRVLALTATYGNGDAPKSAGRFLSRLEKMHSKNLRYAVLAFGDKAFPEYCAFGQAVETAMAEKFATPLLPLTKVDKQSAQTFVHWCGDLGEALGLPLDVHYEPKRPKTRTLTLVSRELYGESIGTKIAILRFSADKLPKFIPGDLVAIYPPECSVPRLYSIGSDAKRDGYLEICVRLQEGGLCSPWLCQLSDGEAIEVAVERNDRFRMPSRKPVVMIGAGTGIAPFTGMIRQNKAARPFDLYWGGRHPDADALYGKEMAQWLASRRLHHCVVAWSRTDERHYVQDKIRADHDHLLERLRSGATVMVCGGQAMASAVRSEFEQLAGELGTSVSELKRRNRYLEDVY